MEYLNNFIITLVATMIFMTSIEIIAPDNSMKKYIKFVLGLILISVMINPIIKFFTGGEQEVINRIKRYEDMLNIFRIFISDFKRIKTKVNLKK